MHMHKIAVAAITSALLLLGGLSAASAAPAGILDAAPATKAAAGADIIKVRRGYFRGRHSFGHRRFRFRLHRGGFRRHYGFRRHRFYRRPHYGYRRHYFRRGYGRRFYF